MWVKNPRTWPRTFLSVGYSCPLASPSEDWQRSFVPWITRRSSLILHTTVECYRRGLHDLGPVTVESKAPFGLFRAKRRFAAPLSVLVYPQIHSIGGLPTLEGLTETTSRPRRARSGEEFSGSRHYFPRGPRPKHPLVQHSTVRPAHGKGVRRFPGEHAVYRLRLQPRPG